MTPAEEAEVNKRFVIMDSEICRLRGQLALAEIHKSEWAQRRFDFINIKNENRKLSAALKWSQQECEKLRARSLELDTLKKKLGEMTK